ncbi:MAG: enoyl-CoA hydratase/isomerase family protein [Bdellovibrionaceae bacterium]|nr:enoyl-CoA hydratase/isomerase family protein [Pseudobdellovibrionaceae bacterium]
MNVQVQKPLLLVHFDDQESRNSFSLEKAERLLKEVKKHQPERLIFTSQGPVFCSGGNLRDYAELRDQQSGVKINERIRNILIEIDHLPIEKIAFISGDCFGGGIELISICHKIYAREDALFALWQSRMHLTFGWGGYERLCRRMRSNTIKEWLAKACVHSSGWCLQNGLIDEVIVSHHWSEKMRETMEQTYTIPWRHMDALDTNEAGVFNSLWWSEEHRKKLSPFIKRE